MAEELFVTKEGRKCLLRAIYQVFLHIFEIGNMSIPIYCMSFLMHPLLL